MTDPVEVPSRISQILRRTTEAEINGDDMPDLAASLEAELSSNTDDDAMTDTSNKLTTPVTSLSTVAPVVKPSPVTPIRPTIIPAGMGKFGGQTPKEAMNTAMENITASAVSRAKSEQEGFRVDLATQEQRLLQIQAQRDVMLETKAAIFNDKENKLQEQVLELQKQINSLSERILENGDSRNTELAKISEEYANEIKHQEAIINSRKMLLQALDVLDGNKSDEVVTITQTLPNPDKPASDLLRTSRNTNK